jgi:UDP-N-acetylglucosamine--N-acetylmuramyl-(pentapeptide) pyrophosphoryl-undecaprenol N-acetylglucosamine transferase
MRVVLTGGGTAGHIYPAIQTGLFLRRKCEASVYYLGRAGSLEERIAKENGFIFYPIASKGLGIKQLVSFTLQNIKGTAQALSALSDIKPDYIFATGGYVCAPILAAAMIKRIPYAIHEQNAASGKANKLFAKGARTLFYSFPTVENRQVCYSGNPVRYTKRREKEGQELVFFGGSGGANSINEAAYDFAVAHPAIPVTIVTGEKRFDGFVKNRELPDNLNAIPYVTDTLPLYESAKVIVSRSGSGALFEIANLGIANVLVPFPQAAEDHQSKNASFFETRGGAVIVKEGDGFTTRLEGAILELWNSDEKRKKQTYVLRTLAQPKSVEEIASRICKDLKIFYQK